MNVISFLIEVNIDNIENMWKQMVLRYLTLLQKAFQEGKGPNYEVIWIKQLRRKHPRNSANREVIYNNLFYFPDSFNRK